MVPQISQKQATALRVFRTIKSVSGDSEYTSVELVSLNNIVKPFLFETATLVGFILIGLLGLWIDSSIRLQAILVWPYNSLGTVPIIVGVALRFWASSTIFNIGKGTPLYSRPTKALVTTGPYRFIRNPLYLGGFIIYLGIIIVIPSLFFAVLGLLGLPIVYVGIVHEEKGLERRFGEDYRQYKRRVPGWVPTIRKSSPT